MNIPILATLVTSAVLAVGAAGTTAASADSNRYDDEWPTATVCDSRKTTHGTTYFGEPTHKIEVRFSATCGTVWGRAIGQHGSRVWIDVQRATSTRVAMGTVNNHYPGVLSAGYSRMLHANDDPFRACITTVQGDTRCTDWMEIGV